MNPSWKPRSLILQHEAATPPGLIKSWLEEQSAEVETLRIDEDDRPVNADDYDLIVSLGSEFAAFDDAVPFVAREARLFEQALESDVPILGLCFGGQMLARVLGSRLYRFEQAEIGWLQGRSHDPDLVTAGQTSTFPRFLDLAYPNIESAGGVWLSTTRGAKILDACSGGAMVSNLGHGAPDIVQAGARQAERIAYFYMDHFTNEPQEELAALLVAVAAPEMARVRFGSSGSEAN